MPKEFKNYAVKGKKVIILLEKDIYTKEMVKSAESFMKEHCKVSVVNNKDKYKIELTAKNKNIKPQDLAVLFNDTLISRFSLY